MPVRRLVQVSLRGPRRNNLQEVVRRHAEIRHAEDRVGQRVRGSPVNEFLIECHARASVAGNDIRGPAVHGAEGEVVNLFNESTLDLSTYDTA